MIEKLTKKLEEKEQRIIEIEEGDDDEVEKEFLDGLKKEKDGIKDQITLYQVKIQKELDKVKIEMEKLWTRKKPALQQQLNIISRDDNSEENLGEFEVKKVTQIKQTF